MISKTGILVLFAVFLLFITTSAKSNSHKSTTASKIFRHMKTKNHNEQTVNKTWFGPFRLVSDVTYYLYLDTVNSSTEANSTVMVNSQSTEGTQTWYFHKLSDGNFSLYNNGADMYLTLTSDQKEFVLAPWDGSDYQRFYVRSFWNGYTINCQINLGYYNYVTVSKSGKVKSLHFNGNPKTQFFQTVGTDILTLV